MSNKIAVAIVHGVGKTKPNFADKMAKELKYRFAKRIGKRSSDPKSELIIKPVYWSPIIQNAQDKLWERVNKGVRLRYKAFREFMVNFAADAFAYQPTPQDRRIYNSIHIEMARIIKQLAKEAGPRAPLCIIAHSLGSIISSNYLYDLQTVKKKKNLIANKVTSIMGNTPLDRGETLALFYSLGSPLALWSLRYPNFGIPITVPSPDLKKHHPSLKGEWVNFYDKDDIIGYPLKTINSSYNKAVKADNSVNVGSIFTSWNPGSHLGYWTDNDITKPIAESLSKAWLKIN